MRAATLYHSTQIAHLSILTRARVRAATERSTMCHGCPYDSNPRSRASGDQDGDLIMLLYRILTRARVRAATLKAMPIGTTMGILTRARVRAATRWQPCMVESEF